MNYGFAREVGYLRYLVRRVLWRIAPPASLTLPTGMEFPLPREKVFSADVFVTEGNLDWNAEYILIGFLKSLPARGDFLDVGAHIGYYSALLRPFVPRIFAFEPDVRNHPFLQAAFAHFSNTEIVPQAVAEQPGEMVLFQELKSPANQIDSEDGTGAVVQVTTIDQFCVNRGAVPSIIRINIEGNNILALRGASETARRHSPVFVVGYNQGAGRPDSWEALQTFAAEHQYGIFAVTREKTFPAGYQYSFRRHAGPSLEGLAMKTLFLVPPKHQAWFEQFASRSGKWNGHALRPQALRRLLAEFPAHGKPVQTDYGTAL